MNNYQENVEYSFNTRIGGEESGLVGINLLVGEYEGVVYRYGKVSVEEDKENDRAYLSFEYDIIDPNNKEDLENDLQFKDHIGNVLQSIMMKSIETNQK